MKKAMPRFNLGENYCSADTIAAEYTISVCFVCTVLCLGLYRQCFMSGRYSILFIYIKHTINKRVKYYTYQFNKVLKFPTVVVV